MKKLSKIEIKFQLVNIYIVSSLPSHSRDSVNSNRIDYHNYYANLLDRTKSNLEKLGEAVDNKAMATNEKIMDYPESDDEDPKPMDINVLKSLAG